MRGKFCSARHFEMKGVPDLQCLENQEHLQESQHDGAGKGYSVWNQILMSQAYLDTCILLENRQCWK